MNNEIYRRVKEFKRKYPMTIAFRLRAHAKIVSKFIGSDEEIKYVFVAQKNYQSYEIINTNIIVLTDKRLVVATKRLVFGYFLKVITPDMFNDLTNEGAKTEVISSDSIKPEVNVRQIPDDNTEEYSTDTFMFNTKDFDKLEDLKDNVRKTSTFIKILIIMLVIIVLAGLGFLVYKFLLK